jgi:thiosulfate/3-mercaptopyruvate sulfurtransferase
VAAGTPPTAMEAPFCMTDYANPDALVSTEWVAEQLKNGNIRLIEVDEDTDAYERGHIPGASSLHWRNELQDPVIRDFVDQGKFEKLMSGKGVGNGDQVVLYGGNNNWFAAYAYWYFKLYGHDNVRLMNGGRKKWELEGRELTAERPNISATQYSAKAADRSIRALRDEVIAGVGKTPMVDVRSPDEFSGKLSAPAHLPQEQAQRNGHIPGARNVPWSKSANEDGTFKSADDLRTLYIEEQGLSDGDETIAYCRIGERSSHTWFVLRELLGFKNVKNYDGSWTEYGSLVGVPIEKTVEEPVPA